MSMKMITDVTIDLYGEIQYYMASAKQGDKATRYLRVQLMNNGNEFQIPDDVILIANIKKPDGKFCYNQCEKENNRVMVQLTSQALAAAGTAYCDIEMRDSDDKLILSSAAFSIEIEKSMRNEDAIESCNEITFLEKKIQQYIDSMLEVRKQVLSTEEAFKIAEAARVLAENRRVDAENIRRENETKRVAAEEIRQEQLLKMQGATQAAETAANRAETTADTAEKTEEAVKTAEAARVLAENGRVDAENIRRENETKRVAAEEVRQEHLNNKSNPHKVTKAQVGLGNVDNTADVNKPVSTAQQNALDASYRQATGYTDRKIADLIGGAPETLDTLKEVADAIQANKDVSTALDAAIGKKANQTELDTHTGNNTIHITSQERTNWNDAKTHADSVHARTDATKTEKSNTNGNVKINGTETTVYTHPNTTGNKHIPSGGSSGQILRWSADGTAAWGGDNDTKVTQQNVAANTDNRLLLSNNANNTDEIAFAKKSEHFLANPYTGELYAKGYRRIMLDGQTVDLNSLNLSVGYPMVQYYIERTDGGAAKIINAPVSSKPFILEVSLIRWASTSDYRTLQRFITSEDYTHEYVRLCTNGSWSAWQKVTHIVDSALSSTSTNPVQNKVVKSALDGKANSNHSHNYAGSPSAGGGASEMYLARVAKSCQYKPGLNKVIFEEFTSGTNYNLPTAHWYHIITCEGNDANYVTQIAIGMTTVALYYRVCGNNSWGAWKKIILESDTMHGAAVANGTSGLVPAPTVNDREKFLRGDGTWQVPANTTYNAATQSTNGLMSAADKKKLDGIADGANKTIVDSALSASSTNPVQNKVVKSALDGKANSNHSHNYAGSSSAGGAANSAAKLQTARTVTIGSQSNTFDGSKDISFNEKDMGLLKITHLKGKSASASNPYKEFAKIKCKGGKYYAGSAYTYTSLNFFMIVNHAVGNMGGYYISTTALKEGMNSLVGGSGNVVFASPVLSDTELVITLFSTNASVIITVIHDAANVEVTQL